MKRVRLRASCWRIQSGFRLDFRPAPVLPFESGRLRLLERAAIGLPMTSVVGREAASGGPVSAGRLARRGIGCVSTSRSGISIECELRCPALPGGAVRVPRRWLGWPDLELLEVDERCCVFSWFSCFLKCSVHFRLIHFARCVMASDSFGYNSCERGLASFPIVSAIFESATCFLAGIGSIATTWFT